MMMGLSQIDLWIVGAYLLATLVIGLYFGWKNNNFKDFAIGNRKFGTMPLVATLFATFCGSESTIGLSEEAFKHGYVYLFVFLGLFISKVAESSVFLRMKKCLDKSVSSGDIMAYFYGRHGKIVLGVITVVTHAAFIGMHMRAVGHLFVHFLGLTLTQGTLLGCGLIVFYSSLGGIRAITATDVLQFSMFFIAIPLLALWGFNEVGGYKPLSTSIPEGHLFFFPRGEETGKYLSMLAIFSIPMMLPTGLQRLLMAESPRQAARAWRLTAVGEIFFHGMVCLIGLLALSMNSQLEPSSAMPWLIQRVTSAGLQGLCIAGLLAVVMSTADSLLHVAIVSLVHDVVVPLRAKPIDTKTELRLAQAASLLLGFFAVISALSLESIVEVNMAFLIFWEVVIPVPLIAAIFGFRASPRTFLLAAGAGVASAWGWNLLALERMGIDPFVPSLLIHTIVFFTARLFDPLHIRVEKKPDGKVVVHAGQEPVSNYSTLQAAEHAWRYALFSIYMMFLYVFSLFLPGTEGYIQLTRAGCGVLIAASCVGYLPMFAEIVPRMLRPHMQLYWKSAVTLCLPTTATFMLLYEPNHLRWVFSAPVCIFLLSIMLPWKQYLVSLPVGIVLGAASAVSLGDPTALQTSFKELPLWLWPNVTGVCVVAFICAYYTQTLQQKRIKAVRVGFTQGVHDGLTPASDVRNRSETVKDYLPRLLEGYKKAQAAGLDVKPLTPDEEPMLQELAETLHDSASGNLSHWTTLLYNTRGEPQRLEVEVLSAVELVRGALRVYPFKFKKERELVTVNIVKDGNFVCDKSIVTVTLHNLLNNSFHYVRKNTGSRIVVTVNVIDGFVVISVWDNAEGLTKEVLENMFVPMFSTREGGSGCGLSSNAKNVAALGGYMEGEGEKTEKEKYALLTMRFPCHKEGEPLPEGVPKPRATYSNIRSEKLFEERKKAMEKEIAHAMEMAKNNPQPPRETPEERDKRIAVQLKTLAARNKKLREEEEKQL